MAKLKNNSLLRLRAILGKEYLTDPPTFGSWLRGRLKSAEEGKVEMEFLIRQEMCNPTGVLHGGVIAGILDEVAGIAVFSLGHPNFHTSINLITDYFAPSFKDDVILARAMTIKVGKKITHLQGELYNKDSRLLARAITNVIWIDKEIGS